MNYSHPELIESLAAEYVLGTLTGSARSRFECLMMDSPAMRRAVWAWEERLAPMAEDVPTEDPPARLWRDIEGQIDGRIIHVPNSRWRRPGVWRALFAAAACLVLALAVLLMQPAEPRQDYLALLQDESAQPLWLVKTNLADGRLRLRNLSVPAQTTTRDYELWMLPGDGGKPVSLGLLPEAGEQAEVALSADSRSLLANTKALAVSVEPPGGSPTGQPTGPVIALASMVAL